MQVLEAKPELASFTFFNYSMNVMHYAAGTQFELLPAALLHVVTCKWGRQILALPALHEIHVPMEERRCMHR